jgi:hypothetical protein
MYICCIHTIIILHFFDVRLSTFYVLWVRGISGIGGIIYFHTCYAHSETNMGLYTVYSNNTADHPILTHIVAADDISAPILEAGREAHG